MHHPQGRWKREAGKDEEAFQGYHSALLPHRAATCTPVMCWGHEMGAGPRLRGRSYSTSHRDIQTWASVHICPTNRVEPVTSPF